MTPKIISVSTLNLRYEMEEAFSDALYTFSARSALFVTVSLDNGVTGYGESAVFGGPPETTQLVIEREIAPHYVGNSPFDVELLWDTAYRRTFQHGRRGIVMAALSGVDIAVWDAMAKICGRPLVDLLGASRRVLPCYASGGFYSPSKGVDQLKAEVSSYVEQGYRAIKVKVGGASLEVDSQRVRAVRKAVGDEVLLMIDANGALSLAHARALATRLEDSSIFWFEEPVSVDNRRGSSQLRRAIGIPVAGYEVETSLVGFRDLVEADAIDIAQPDVSWAGGITQVRRIAAYCHAWNLLVAPHCFGGAIALAATAHLLASIPNGSLLETDGNPNPLRTDVVDADWLAPAKGQIRVSDEPGLGISLNEMAIERYRP